jgi:hypothetical protein
MPTQQDQADPKLHSDIPKRMTTPRAAVAETEMV